MTSPASSVSDASLVVTEIYASIQGESTFAGRPCVFVRLTGCPLRCDWCDTEYAFTGGERMTLEEILRRVKSHGMGLVEVTGGEPLAQSECLTLLARLVNAGYETLLETSGALDVSKVDPRVVKIMDLKCPGSGEEASNRWENLAALTPRDEIKFVIKDRADYQWAERVVRERGWAGRHVVLFSPVKGALDPADLAAWMIADRSSARLQIQMHKILWPNETQGR